TGIDPRGENFVVRPLCQVNPTLPKGIEYIIDKCIQLNPKDRYQNCAELLNDLTHYMELPR
ncbi:MAG: serine/threonine protein kinase, partial [Candidatus Fimenecus sp.]